MSIAVAPGHWRLRTFACIALIAVALGCTSSFGQWLENDEIMQRVAGLKPEDIPALEAASDSGDGNAQLVLGLAYRFGKGVPPDDARAADYLKKAALQGSSSAQSDLGVMYEKGMGVTQSDSEAVRWYRQAAEQGNAPAQANLASMYERGEGVKKDLDRANEWLRKSADQGYPEALLGLALYRKNGVGGKADALEAANLMKAASQKGSAQAQLLLAGMYISGEDELPVDDHEAVRWLHQSYAQAGASNPAHFILTLMHPQRKDNAGVEEDRAALASLRNRTESGDTRAQLDMGMILYLAQQTVPGCTWLMISAQNGEKDAKEMLKALQPPLVSKSQRKEAERRARKWKRQGT